MNFNDLFMKMAGIKQLNLTGVITKSLHSCGLKLHLFNMIIKFA
jgi:hypothetical protein